MNMPVILGLVFNVNQLQIQSPTPSSTSIINKHANMLEVPQDPNVSDATIKK